MAPDAPTSSDKRERYLQRINALNEPQRTWMGRFNMAMLIGRFVSAAATPTVVGYIAASSLDGLIPTALALAILTLPAMVLGFVAVRVLEGMLSPFVLDHLEQKSRSEGQSEVDDD